MGGVKGIEVMDSLFWNEVGMLEMPGGIAFFGFIMLLIAITVVVRFHERIFDEVEEKIKIIGYICFVLAIVLIALSVVWGIYLGGEYDAEEGWLLFLLIAKPGISCIILAFIFYALGQFVDDVHSIKINTDITRDLNTNNTYVLNKKPENYDSHEM